MEWVPLGSFELVKVAFPLLSVRVPNTVVPSLKLTLPAGMPEVDDFTVAVNVTDRPRVEGFFELATDVGSKSSHLGSSPCAGDQCGRSGCSSPRRE